MTTPATFEQVKSFTAKFTGTKPAKITLGTTLEHDLGITGDDGEDFMWAFFNEFGVDYTGFKLPKYFVPEGFDLIGLTHLIRKLFSQPPLTSPIHDITIADLVKSVNERRWIDPVVDG